MWFMACCSAETGAVAAGKGGEHGPDSAPNERADPPVAPASGIGARRASLNAHPITAVINGNGESQLSSSITQAIQRLMEPFQVFSDEALCTVLLVAADCEGSGFRRSFTFGRNQAVRLICLPHELARFHVKSFAYCNYLLRRKPQCAGLCRHEPVFCNPAGKSETRYTFGPRHAKPGEAPSYFFFGFRFSVSCH